MLQTNLARWRNIKTYPMKNTSDPCPCGSGSALDECCGKFLDEGIQPQTAQTLMRSRYTAFVRMDESYLLETWHPQTRPSRVSFDLETRWLGLKIKSCEQGGIDDDTGTVEFVARCKKAGKAQRLHEKSRFERIDGRWYYRDGEHFN